MGKIFMAELADMLAQKAGISKREAQQFLTDFVETIQDGVNNDKLVKIKGLGTFKVIDVDARESVNVNTGERVTIDSHQKLTFTPDAAMKELVNKPFSQFETVVLNEGVDFNEASVDLSGEAETAIPEETEESAAPLVEFVDETQTAFAELPKEEETTIAETPVVAPEKTTTEAQEESSSEASEKTQVKAPEEVPEDAPEETNDVEESDTFGESEEPEETEVADDYEEGPGFKRYLKWIGLVLLAMAVFLIGYLAGKGPQTTPQEPKTEAVEKEPITSLSNDSNAVKTETEMDEESSEDDEETENDDGETEEDESLDKWETMDVRVKTGAYRILGTDTVVKARTGDNLTRISNRLLGPGMECYLEVYNGLSKGAVLSAGQEIKIPKIELKKKKKKIE